jgi:hypothetical protein
MLIKNTTGAFFTDGKTTNNSYFNWQDADTNFWSTNLNCLVHRAEVFDSYLLVAINKND